MSRFLLPLQFGVLEHFCHPDPGHMLAVPVWAAGEAWAGNGFMAIRVRRGLWLEGDFPDPPAGAALRLLGLPWGKFERLADAWRPMEDAGRALDLRGIIAPWTERHRCAPSPVWRVSTGFLARKSHMQLIGRLPRCEVYVAGVRADEPLLFRFSGGIGMVMPDKRLTEWSFELFRAKYCPLDGHELEYRRPRPDAPRSPLVLPMPADAPIEDWPPAEVE